MYERPDDLLTYEMAAHEIGIKLESLRQVINRGALHPIKIPRQRNKFLRRAEVLQYRDGKPAQDAPEKMISAIEASNSPKPSATPHLSSASHQEISDQILLLITEANRALVASAEAYHTSTAIIQYGLFEALQYYHSVTGTEGPQLQLARDLNKQIENTQAGSQPRRNTSADPAGDFFQRIQEALGQREVPTRASE